MREYPCRSLVEVIAFRRAGCESGESEGHLLLAELLRSCLCERYDLLRIGESADRIEDGIVGMTQRGIDRGQQKGILLRETALYGSILRVRLEITVDNGENLLTIRD